MRTIVVIPAFNMAATIGQAIRSVLGQTHRDLRLVVVDDGSTDATASIAAGFSDPRLALIRQPNAGVAAARNRGMGVAVEADALLFLDADDWLAPAALAILAAALAASPCAVAAVGPYAWVDPDGRPAGRPIMPPAAGLERRAAPRLVEQPVGKDLLERPVGKNLLQRLVVQNQFANGGHVLIRRAGAQRAGPFLAGLAYGEDWEFFVRLALQGPFAGAPAPTPLLFVRSRPEGAYRRMAADPAAVAPCMAAIFGNPALAERFPPGRLAALRDRAEAENAWIIGRELLRQGRGRDGKPWLARSVAAAPSLRRIALLAAAHALPMLPQAWRGPFRGYARPHQSRTAAAQRPADG